MVKRSSKGKSKLALKTFQRDREEWSEDRMKQLDFINKGLRGKNEARLCISNIDEATLEFPKKIKPLSPEPQLSDFYHPLEGQKNCELLFFLVGTGLETYAIYKYLKKMADEKLKEVYYRLDHL